MLGNVLPRLWSSVALIFDDSGQLAVELNGGFIGYTQRRYVSGGDAIEGLVILTSHNRNCKKDKIGSNLTKINEESWLTVDGSLSLCFASINYKKIQSVLDDIIFLLI